MRLPKAKRINVENYIRVQNTLKIRRGSVKLSANESALGPSPKAIKEYNKVSKNFKRYPDTNGNILRETIAKNFNLDSSRVILGAGSDQILELVCNAFLEKNDEVIVPKFSFIIYRLYSKKKGAKVILAKEENFKISVKNILSLVTKKTKIIFLANPNNPTGTFINKKEILFLRKKLRNNILLVIDDAYCEYPNKKDYKSGLEIFSKYKNVLITRTFSKIYGLAGLRVGWGYSSKDIINSLNKVKPPFNVSRPALFAATASIKDKNWLKKEIKHVAKWRKIFYKVFQELKIDTNETHANFFLLKFDDVKLSSNFIFKALLKSGILVRKMDIYGIKNSLRVTIGTSKENKKFIKAIKRLI